jgi:hypothetical protein
MTILVGIDTGGTYTDAALVQIKWKDNVIDAGGPHDEGYFLGSEIRATAIGRPNLASG